MENNEKEETNSTVHFCTGSSYEGDWHHRQMHGIGTYTLPTNVKYNGNMKGSRFHGKGILTFPTGTTIEGFWHNGIAKGIRLKFSDGLKFNHSYWKYCQGDDRRYYKCIVYGLPAIGDHYITTEKVQRVIPPGCYDTGKGFYNPNTKTLFDPATKKVIGIPTKSEEDWIIRHCRRGTFDPESNLIPSVSVESLFNMQN